VRMTLRTLVAAIALAALGVASAPRAAAQDDQFLMPEQSAAKAKQLLEQAIEALGGSTYLNVHDVTCTGRIGQFDHAGELTGFGTFIDYAQPPFKERQENLPKRNIIEVYNGDKGWDLDRGGVSEAPRADLADFQETVKKDLDNILRHRMHEPDMTLRYSGEDIVDLKQVDWVELIDGENRTIRIAIAQATHLPIRKTVDTRNPRTQMKSQEVEYYSNYHPIDGVQTAFQLTRERNGIKIFQAFFDKCEYNTNLSDALFTKESLEQRWAQVGKKEMAKEAKGKEKDKDKDKDKDQDKDSSSPDDQK
jgi:hypothetical protein